MNYLIEMATTAFEKKGDFYHAVKTRNGELVLGGAYSEEFVKRYANSYLDVVIVTSK